MRVAMLSPLFESVPPRLYGGTERVVFNLCRGLRSSDIEVVLFSSGDSAVDVKTIPVIDEALRLRKNPIADPIAYNFRMLSMVHDRVEEFDLIHNHHDYWMLPLSRMTSTPMITTLHGRMDLPDQRVVFSNYLNTSYVSISDAQRLPMPQLPWLKTIHHGIDVNSFKFQEKPGNYLAFLGRISSEKRPEWAIDIAYRSGVPLKIAAKIEGDMGRNYYDTHIKRHVDGRFIEYVGEISESEKSTFLGNALALTFPIDWPEPFGLVLIESLACGTPVLARPCGAVPEILKDGITGYMHPSLEVLAAKVDNIHKIDRRSCRQWVERKFSLQRMTEDYIHVYRHFAERKANSTRHRWNLIHPLQRIADGDT